MNGRPQILNHEERILILLHKIRQTRTIIKLEHPQATQHFNSMILGVKEHPGILQIDQIVPTEGNQAIQKPGRIILRFIHDGIPHFFFTKYTGFKLEEHLPIHELSIPDTIWYLDKRDTQRIPLEHNDPPRVTLTNIDQMQISGNARDLSNEGLSVVIKESDIPNIGGLIRCRITSKATAIDLFGLITYREREIRTGHTRFGVKFIDLTEENQLQLTQMIEELQADPNHSFPF